MSTRKRRALIPRGKDFAFKGKVYRPVLFRIDDHWPDGRIKTCTMLHDDQTVNVEDETQRHFLTAFVQEQMIERKAN